MQTPRSESRGWASRRNDGGWVSGLVKADAAAGGGQRYGRGLGVQVSERPAGRPEGIRVDMWLWRPGPDDAANMPERCTSLRGCLDLYGLLR